MSVEPQARTDRFIAGELLTGETQMKKTIAFAIFILICLLFEVSCSSKDASTPTTAPVASSNSATPTTDAPAPASTRDTGLESRYKWKSSNDIPMPADSITVKQNRRGRLEIGQAPGSTGGIPFGGDEVVIDAPGSRDVRIQIDPAVKKTTYAGLVFTTPCVVGISEDTTVTVDQEGLAVKDTKGKQWTSRKVTLDSKQVMALFPSK